MYDDYQVKQERASMCQPDYEAEYHRLLEMCQRLTEENEKLKTALVNIALKL